VSTVASGGTSTATAAGPAVGLPKTTGVGPRAADIWRAARAPLAIAVLLVVFGTLLAVVRSGGRRGELDPAGVDPAGSRALATLLRERGVDVRRVHTVAEAASAGLTGGTVFVPLPERLPRGSLGALANRGGADLVLVDPDDDTLAALAAGVRRGGPVEVASRQPACDLPAAAVAGSAALGGTAYDVTDPDAIQCYPSGGRPTLVALTAAAGRVTVLGASALFTNERLADDGNAALALGLLGQRPTLLWLLPTPGQLPPRPAAEDAPGLLDLLPDRVLLAVDQLAVAVVLFALWRARRLGPVVAETLPVVVRSAETVEGRARLYRASGARPEAAEALRAGVRTRLGDLLGRPPDGSGAALAQGVAARTGRPAGTVSGLLYGAGRDVPDDAALVRLAGELDAVEREVRRR